MFCSEGRRKKHFDEEFFNFIRNLRSCVAINVKRNLIFLIFSHKKSFVGNAMNTQQK